MNDQEAYEQARAHCAQMTGRCVVDEDGLGSERCLYINLATGCRCAIGALLTWDTAKALDTAEAGTVDEILEAALYNVDTDCSDQELVSACVAAARELEGCTKDFLSDLQPCHDAWQSEEGPFGEVVPKKMDDVARKYGLQVVPA